MSAAVHFASHNPGNRNHLVADNLAAALRRRGHDAHAHGPDVGGIGVEIRAAHVVGWRYPDGRWVFQDQPVQITAEPDESAALCWSLVDHRGELAVPAFGSVDAIAEWIACELPAPEHLTCRLERHPDFIDADSGSIPLDWYQAWHPQEAHNDGV